MDNQTNIVLGVIGGSGLYQFKELEQVQQLELTTPFGNPSSPITIGIIGNISIGFIARHGLGHTLTPSEVNYRANIYALKMLGAKKVVSISACGSLREDYAPSNLVVPNQLFDFTKGRKTSFFGDNFVAHIGVADPFCPQFSKEVYNAIQTIEPSVKFGGTAITIEGPRFSTKAESQLYRMWGLDLIGMTTAPEAFLAKEAELCYTVIFHVTDYDVWHQTEEPVSVEQVFQNIKKNVDITQRAIKSLAENFNPHQDCDCPHALKHAFTTAKNAIPDETYQRLKLLVDKYHIKT